MALKPVRVSQLNSYIKRILQTDPILGNVSVIGEISNLKFHGSGHVYFSLKDEGSKVSCFLAADKFAVLTCELEEGLEITASGYIYLYERGGSYSLNIRDIQVSGQGNLAAEFQKLKVKLEKEGLFDTEHKKAIPAFPGKVAVVTSETGAAVRDIVKTIRIKNDFTDILIYPVLVQGPGAAGEISAAIENLNMHYSDVDIIIAGRGGGSMEELWAFNEEIVARSIYESDIPVISAVGHETDFTIADFVADLRAETPTAAAERAVPDTFLLRENLETIKKEMKRNLNMIVEDRRKRLELLDPEAFGRDIRSRIIMDQMRLDNTAQKMGEQLRTKVRDYRYRLDIIRESLEACNPDNILEKGYSVVTDEAGAIVRDAGALRANELVSIRACTGTAQARITGTRRD
ncbi:MAG: exodeoxyribonuclease VII large subunit [Lentihominibacter sp.]